ncbi:Lactamase-B domain-containing protein [Fusarium keratoplasticum]|nr:Lactamase-B domain-containing protein [Fusarium keratoplasticum]
MAATLEWFGATTYRLRTNGLTIFLDSWLDKPARMPRYLELKDVQEADYIFISHAHFDHLPGSDVIAKRTGAMIVANGEAINIMREAGVPEEQLLPVGGGERIPLFTKDIRDKATKGLVELEIRPPGAPKSPHPSLAVAAVHVWPSLHTFMPEDHPELMDTGVRYVGASTDFFCTLNITIGMKHGLLRLGDLIPREQIDQDTQAFVDYVNDTEKNKFSHYDGGQLMFNILTDGKALLWSAHLGGYEGVLRDLQPQPDVAIIAVAGRANLNGRPFDGSAAEFLVKKARWIGEPNTIIWCLHDKSLVKPFSVDTNAATEAIQRETKSRVKDLVPGKSYKCFD